MKKNLTMLTDFYELTMSDAYFNSNLQNKWAVFDAFYRKNPFDTGYGIMAGLDEVIKYIANLHFDDEDIEYLRSLNQFSEDFLKYLKNFKFTGNIYAVPDGTIVFGNEPLITVEAPIIEAQIVETMLLNLINPHICFTTAAKRIVDAADGIPIMEFGARRALGPDAANFASKCAVMAGCVATSNTLDGKLTNDPVSGTMAHSFVEFYPNEYEAFLAYAKTYPDNCVLLVDTYNVLKSGIPNAIRVAKEYLIPNGYNLKGIRIDSGDLAYLSKEAKKMLIDAGLGDVKICISNGLTEETIKSLKEQGAVIDSIGLGDNIVLPDKARVGCVYKLVAIKDKGIYQSKIKVSEEDIKVTNPGFKKLYRFYDKNTGFALGDVLTLHDEVVDRNRYTLINPQDELKTTTLTNYIVRPLQVPIFKNGVLVYQDPTLKMKKEYLKAQADTIYPEIKRKLNPHRYYVDLSRELLTLKKELIEEARKIETPKLERLR